MPSALITGGSSGIGLAIARMLREEGCANARGRKVERLEAAAAELEATAVPWTSATRTTARGSSRPRRAHGTDVLVQLGQCRHAGRIGDMETAV
jgi:NADP-dependent 3-hydroxy acid dehydrogenase YdfG